MCRQRNEVQLLDQFQHAPEAGIFAVRKLGSHTEDLLAQFSVSNGVVKPQAAVLLRIKSIEHAGRQERLQNIAALGARGLKRHFARAAKRSVLKRAIDLNLAKHRFIAVRTASGRKEMKLVAMAASAMAGACIAGIDPE